MHRCGSTSERRRTSPHHPTPLSPSRRRRFRARRPSPGLPGLPVFSLVASSWGGAGALVLGSEGRFFEAALVAAASAGLCLAGLLEGG